MPEEQIIRMTIAYDGADYMGWQIQPGRRTIQGEIESALAHIAGRRVVVIGASRTDSGVHARGQIASFRWGIDIHPERLPFAINSRLSPDIRVLDCRVAQPDFDARRSCIGKTYAYTMCLSRIQDPLNRRYTAHVPFQLDLSAMADAAQVLQGEIDLSVFSRAEAIGRLGDRGSIRKITFSKWHFSEHTGIFRISADGFLRHSIRCIVGTMIEIGRGRIQTADMLALIQGGCGRAQLRATTMPACGLCLEKVNYNDAAVLGSRE